MKNGLIYKDKYEGWYSVSDEAFYSTSQVQKTQNPNSKEKPMVSHLSFALENDFDVVRPGSSQSVKSSGFGPIRNYTDHPYFYYSNEIIQLIHFSIRIHPFIN